MISSQSDIDKNLDMNIKTCQNAFQSYNQLLNEIKNALRTGNFNKNNLLIAMNNIDNIMAVNCLIVDKYYLKYSKIFKDDS